MHTLQDEVRSVLLREGLIGRRQHPGLARAVDALARTGALTAVLPGVYVATGEQTDFLTRVRAAVVWDPDVVFTCGSAARLTFWPDLTVATVEGAVRWQRVDRPGFRFSRRAVPPELVVERGPLRCSDPALTALDLCASRGGDGIDQALRTRATTLRRMRRALDLTPGRPGNPDRRALLLDSRDEPWSAAERLFHRMLRGARITGWRPNLPVRVRGATYFLDVAFPDLTIVVEIDGRLHQTDRAVFESDRVRQNALVLDGWLVLRFTWRQLEDHPDQVLALVLEAISVKSSTR